MTGRFTAGGGRVLPAPSKAHQQLLAAQTLDAADDGDDDDDITRPLPPRSELAKTPLYTSKRRWERVDDDDDDDDIEPAPTPPPPARHMSSVDAAVNFITAPAVAATAVAAAATAAAAPSRPSTPVRNSRNKRRVVVSSPSSSDSDDSGSAPDTPPLPPPAVPMQSALSSSSAATTATQPLVKVPPPVIPTAVGSSDRRTPSKRITAAIKSYICAEFKRMQREAQRNNVRLHYTGAAREIRNGTRGLTNVARESELPSEHAIMQLLRRTFDRRRGGSVATSADMAVDTIAMLNVPPEAAALGGSDIAEQQLAEIAVSVRETTRLLATAVDTLQRMHAHTLTSDAEMKAHVRSVINEAFQRNNSLNIDGNAHLLGGSGGGNAYSCH